jgi:membrane peptidoglycan carboxypeptidase
VTGAGGKEYDVPKPECTRGLTADIAAGVTYALEDVVSEGTAKDYPLAGGRPAAGKTGTANHSMHLWFMGYTPQLVATVWMGNPAHDVVGEDIRINGKPYRILFGSTISLPTWKHFMDRSLKGQKILQFPGVSNDVLYGVPRDVPNVIGMTEAKAKYALNAAGFRYSKQTQVVFDPNYVKGTVVAQAPGGSSRALPGATITYYIGTTKVPDWWYNWPAGWDPNTPPSDYWGDVWPPPEFASNPPNGWPGTEPTPDPGNGGGPGGPDGPGGGKGGGNH